MITKTAQSTNWLSPDEQQVWFDQFKSDDQLSGLRFIQFQKFLAATIYTYFETIPAKEVEGKFTYQQELQLFKIFDSKSNDNVIDRSEFAHLCQHWIEKTYRRVSALVVVDVQNDFIDGSLALINGPAKQDGAEVVPVINNLLDECNFNVVVYTQDWHPIDHIGFHDNLHLRKYTLKQNNSHGSGAKLNGDNIDDKRSESARFKLKRLVSKANLFDVVMFDEGRIEQKLWPRHCVQNSWGAQLHEKLKVKSNSIRILKGTMSQVDAYSAFWDNMRLNETGLRKELLSRRVDDVFFCGLALDYCVAASALDSANSGFMTFVIEDACRGIDEDEMKSRKQELIDNGVLMVRSESIKNFLLPRDHNDSTGLSNTQMLDRSLAISVCFSRAMTLRV